MTNVQLYLSVGLPILAILISLAIQLQSLASFRGELASFRGELGSFRAEFASFREEVIRRFDATDKRIDKLESEMNRRFDATDKRIDKIERDLAETKILFVKDFSDRIARLEERTTLRS